MPDHNQTAASRRKPEPTFPPLSRLMSGSRLSRIAVRDFGEGAASLEGKAILRMRRSQVWWFGRGFIGLAQLERPEQAEFEAGEQQGGAGLEGAGGGLMQDAQQHEGDQRHLALDLDGVCAAP